jgi:hypothetical protein
MTQCTCQENKGINVMIQENKCFSPSRTSKSSNSTSRSSRPLCDRRRPLRLLGTARIRRRRRRWRVMTRDVCHGHALVHGGHNNQQRGSAGTVHSLSSRYRWSRRWPPAMYFGGFRRSGALRGGLKEFPSYRYFNGTMLRLLCDICTLVLKSNLYLCYLYACCSQNPTSVMGFNHCSASGEMNY